MTERMTTPLALSVIVPSHNRVASVLRLLGALRAQANPVDGVAADRFEVVVVADGCSDDTVSVLRQAIASNAFPFALRVVEQSPAQGAGIARNAGAAQARGDTLVFVDDDIEPFATMLSTHEQLHADATSRGDALVLVGAPIPLRASDPSLHHIAAWGWWEQQFEQMSAPGHRFTYDEVFTGILSMPASLFQAVGGFDATLGDCHEDSELGLRLFRAGARGAFSRAAGGMHHEVRNLVRLLPRKWAEGRADVRILRRWPELVAVLKLAEREPPRRSWMGMLRRPAFAAPRVAHLFPRVMLPLLTLIDRWRWRHSWRKLHGGVLVLSYWRGVASEVGSEAALRDLVAESRHAWSRWRDTTRHLTIDLSLGLDAAEHLLERERPDRLTVRLGEHLVGEVAALPAAERLHGGHLRRILGTTLNHSLRVALALRLARMPNDTSSYRPSLDDADPSVVGSA